MNKEETFYWVKAYDEWHIARWDAHNKIWKLTGDDIRYEDDNDFISSVNENKLTPPEQ